MYCELSLVMYMCALVEYISCIYVQQSDKYKAEVFMYIYARNLLYTRTHFCSMCRCVQPFCFVCELICFDQYKADVSTYIYARNLLHTRTHFFPMCRYVQSFFFVCELSLVMYMSTSYMISIKQRYSCTYMYENIRRAHLLYNFYIYTTKLN